MTSLARGALAGVRGLADLVPKGVRSVAAASTKDKALAGATGLFLADVGAPVGRAVNPLINSRKEKRDRAREGNKLLLRNRRRTQRLQQAVQQNIMRIAAVDPHLYNELLNKRPLPKGAVVIGGNPQPDYLNEVAFNMATGRMAVPEGLSPTSTGSGDALSALTQQ